MRGSFNRSAGVMALVLLSAVPLAAAAGPDLRLVNAAADQDTPKMRALIKQGVNVNTARVDGVTPLLWAAHWNDLEMVELLLRAHANVNAADDHGVTPLARASENSNLDIVNRLLAAGGNPNAAQTSGLTPLMTATHTGNLPVAKALLAAGANVNASTAETQNTALMWAIGDQHTDIAKMLIEGRADVHAVSKRGFTPLMFAARNGDIEMAKTLVAAGVGVNEMPPDATHVLPYAISVGQADFAKFLLDNGADPNGAMDGVTALHISSGNADIWLQDWNRRHGGAGQLLGGFGGGQGPSPARRLELVKALLARGADPNRRTVTSGMLMSYIGFPKKGAFETYACGTGDLRGATPLWIAAFGANMGLGGFGAAAAAGDGAGAAAAATSAAGAGRMGRGSETTSEIIQALLAAGADQRISTDDGTTPLMAAAGLGRATFQPGLQRGRRSIGAEEAVTLLLNAPGADINGVNEADFTALHGAAFRGLDEVIQILVDKGANIDARDFRGRTPYRLAEGSKQSFQFQAYPETAEFIKKLGANIKLGVPGTVQERNRDVQAASATGNAAPTQK